MTFSCANIVYANSASFCLVECLNMGVDQVSDINVIPYTSAIRSFVVGTLNLQWQVILIFDLLKASEHKICQKKKKPKDTAF